MTLGTRTFCYLDDPSSILDESADGAASAGPLLVIREILLSNDSSTDVGDRGDESDENNVQPVCEYGVTLVDAMRGSVTIGQFADDVLRSRLMTLLASFTPSEVRSMRLNIKCQVRLF
jgi:DNA mismatch repair protein MSH6